MKRLPGLVLLAALVCLVVCNCVASSALAAATGAISGKVTDATTHKPIEKLEVCAFSLTAEGPEEEASGNAGCAQTGASGEYTISALNAGSYGVIFALFSSTSSTNYVAQVYKELTLSSEQPTPVPVNAGTTTSAIDAELQEGSEVSGRITNAATGASVAGAAACALRAGTEGLELTTCARSQANGEYTLRGIPNGSFYIGFIAPELATQYYPGKASFTEASAVTISAPKAVKTGIDAAMQPRPPEPSNVEGSTTGGPPGSGFGPQLPGPLGGKLGSSTLAVSLSSQRIDVAHDAIADLELACVATTSCHGKLVLTLKRTVRHRGKTLLKTVTLGAVRYSLRHGQKATVHVRLDAKARRLLRSAKGALAAQLTISQRAPTPSGVELENVVLLERRPASGR